MFSARRTIRGFNRTMLLALVCMAPAVAAGATVLIAPARPTSQPEATSQPAAQPADPAIIKQAIADLASPDATLRESAQVGLMHLKREDLPALRQTLQRSSPLAPSQASCLRQIVREIYLAGEDYRKEPTKGFLGILMEKGPPGTVDLQQPNQDGQVTGVIVGDRIPGFCASRLLRDGDIILGTINPSVTFHNFMDLQAEIVRLDPGAVVRLQVLRQGQVIEVSLILDTRPLEAEPGSVEDFTQGRAKKFEDYWQKTFAPLLKEAVASN
jgi:hypothetical protein